MQGICLRCKAHKAREYRYGISLAEFETLLAAQGGRCAICGTGNPPKRPRDVDGWHVDHCHRTGDVRGILCRRCNTAIALMDDDSAMLHLAAEYIEYHAPVV